MKPKNAQEAYDEIEKLGQHVGSLYDKVGKLEKTKASAPDADLAGRLKAAEDQIELLLAHSKVPRSRG